MIPVLISGGSGTRLWPVSRTAFPKQFCDLFENSLIEESIQRLSPLGKPHILTTKSLEVLTKKVATKHQLIAKHLIFEPMGRNTAPAIALLCHLLLLAGHNNEVVGVFPSDQFIEDNDGFRAAVTAAAALAEKGSVVTLGIAPTFPATGYGYIEVDDYKPGSRFDNKAYKVTAFREKPSHQQAESFIAQKKFFWNAGIFVFRLDTVIEAFKTLTPDLWNQISKIKADLSNAADIYGKVTPISFDYAVMEKLKNQMCIPCDIGWSDVGSWDQISEMVPGKTSKPVLSKAKVFEANGKGNFVFSDREKIVGFVGCNDLIVADTADATLICKKGDSQSVKVLGDLMKAKSIQQLDAHTFDHRPWGKYEILSDNDVFKAKTITVEPGAQLSYQSHNKRAEHWIMVSGQAEVTLDDKVHHLKAGEHIYIPLKAKHRIKNPSLEPLVFVEVQTGTYFGEDDIIRYQDDYNRA